MLAAAGPQTSYEVEVRKMVSARLGGAIFAGLVTGPLRVPEEGKEIRVTVPAAAMRGAEPVQGEIWSVRGGWTTHPKYGRQFRAEQAYRMRPSGRLVVSYLADHVPGIGRGRAERLWTVFGERLPEVLDREDIGALAEAIAPRYPGLSLRLAADVVASWKEATAEPAIIAWLDGLGVTDTRLVRRIVRILGDKTRDALECNPYILTAFMDKWSKVDELGLRLLKENGVAEPRKDIGRLVGAVDFVIRDMVSGEGHTIIDAPSLRTGLARCLKAKADSGAIDEAVRLGEVNGATLPLPDGTWRAPGCAVLEEGLADRFRAMLEGREQSQVGIPSRKALERVLDRLVTDGPPLHPEQQEAVLRCLQAPLAVLSGGAGVGKTTTVRAIVALWEELGGRVELCALAGKAALRLSQSTSRLARTIHRLLAEMAKPEDDAEAAPQSAAPDAPRLDARTLLIVDEASMVNLGQWHRLVQAMPPGCRLLMVGDVGQLPPIGFGLVFHRLAHMPDIAAELKTIHRQAEGSGIPAVSRAIRDGIVPALPPFEGKADGVFLLPCPRHEIPARIEEVVADLGGFGTGHALQVVAPVNDGDAGVDGLNARFHDVHRRVHGIDVFATFGDEARAQEVRGHLGQFFAIGEPVIHQRNDYQRALFNGSLGHVEGIDPARRTVRAAFDGEVIEFGPDALLDIALAYCLTCHRLQGSQSERIVVALYDHERVMDVSWIYTAITRAERQVVLVGAPETLAAAVGRSPAWTNRRVAFRLNPRSGESGSAS
ncbi:MAG TPA: AAA family ATPase [Azospirillum sp.]